MPGKRLRSNVFMHASIAIYDLSAHGTCDLDKISPALEATELLINEGCSLRTNGHCTMPYVDAAMFAIYPNKSEGDIVELKGILEEARDILRRLNDSRTITPEESAQVMTYCQEMRFQLALAEKGYDPHRPLR